MVTNPNDFKRYVLSIIVDKLMRMDDAILNLNPSSVVFALKTKFSNDCIGTLKVFCCIMKNVFE